MSRKSTWQRLFVWAAVLLTFGIIFTWLLNYHLQTGTMARPQAACRIGPVTITAATAQGNIPVYLAAIGTVTPVYTASITSEVTGMVNNGQ